jgi:ATP-dependent phosphoenolpyruvate carboxykinase
MMLALVLAAPVSAVAATPNYTNPVTTAHHAKEQAIYVTFVNHTSQEREVIIGNSKYTVGYNSVLNVLVPAGSVARVYSSQNSKIDGQQTILLAASDAKTTVYLK